MLCIALVAVACTRARRSRDPDRGGLPALGIAGTRRHRRAPRHHARRRPGEPGRRRRRPDDPDRVGGHPRRRTRRRRRSISCMPPASSWCSAATAARSPGRRRPRRRRTACCSGRPARSGCFRPDSDRGGLTFRVPPTGEVLGQVGDRVHRRSGGARTSPRPRDAPVRGLVRGRRVRQLRRRRAPRPNSRSRGLHDVGNFGYDFRTVDMAKLVRADRGRQARRPVRIGVPRRRHRAPAAAGARSTSRCSRTSARRPATACRRSARRWARTRSAFTRRTSRRPRRSTPSGLRADARVAAAARERRVSRRSGTRT